MIPDINSSICSERSTGTFKRVFRIPRVYSRTFGSSDCIEVSIEATILSSFLCISFFVLGNPLKKLSSQIQAENLPE